MPVQPGTPHSSPALPTRSAPLQQREGLPPTQGEVLELERSPIQNSPWKETSLDRLYEKPKKQAAEPCSLPRYRAWAAPIAPSLLWGALRIRGLGE